MKMPWSLPRSESGVAACRMVVRNSMDTESMTPAATSTRQDMMRGHAVSRPQPPDATRITAPNAMMLTAHAATAAAHARP